MVKLFNKLDIRTEITVCWRLSVENAELRTNSMVFVLTFTNQTLNVVATSVCTRALTGTSGAHQHSGSIRSENICYDFTTCIKCRLGFVIFALSSLPDMWFRARVIIYERIRRTALTFLLQTSRLLEWLLHLSTVLQEHGQSSRVRS